MRYEVLIVISSVPVCPQVSDWYIDFSPAGGTDREGWQYAADFPA